MSISNVEMLEILAKPWAGIKDIELLADCKETKVCKIKNRLKIESDNLASCY